MVTLTHNPAGTLGNVSTLVINNDLKILDLLKNVMDTLGFGTVLTATDGYQAIDALRSNKIDVVTTDWELRPSRENASEIPDNETITTAWGKFPPVNGANFVRSLRHSPKSPNQFVPVVMMASGANKNQVLYARDAGVNEMLLKPIDADELCERIASVIDSPRPFVTCLAYKGPCRRRRGRALPENTTERRTHNIELVEYNPLIHKM